MLTTECRGAIKALIQQEVVPAMGCTEPIAVSLCTARATETLGALPEKITVLLSPNVLKNAMGVGIPGTDMIGLPIAIALGAVVGKSAYGLEVLRDVCPQAVAQGQQMIDNGAISVGLKEGGCDMLHIEVIAEGEGGRAVAVISGAHTNFVYIERNGEVLIDQRTPAVGAVESKTLPLNLRTVWDYAMESPIEELEFILEARRLNKAAADESLKGEWGHCLGRMLQESPKSRNIMGDTTLSHMISYTSAACDARMGGAKIPVMSNSGSGNQGIVSTLPVVVYAEDMGCSEEQLVRALILSHLTVIYIKQSLGRLSALCGCVVASTGSSCGVTYLMGGGYEEVAMAVKNMVATLTGMICDGAKPSCALKLSSAVSTAVMAATMAMEHHCVSAYEGIVDDDVDQSILNLTSIGSRGMLETDKLILNIMTHKGN
ncbi:MAG: serine dehydratase subunit alpha family protein [Tidjanibacter sp.]|nr:serine dehydratase subunit alpha family protein [Tidjanibacter sp.]